MVFNHKDKKLAFNSISCVLAEVDNDFLTMLQNENCNNLDESGFTDKQRELVRNMKDNGFLIDDDFDELSFLEYNFNLSKYGNDEPSVTILPTSACNCCCPYCFEGDYKNKSDFMTNDVKEAIYKQIELITAGKKRLHVTWFGGEPLLAKKDIWEMSMRMIAICKKNGVEYNAHIITNGYLIDEQTVQDMIDAKITGARITLDGTPEIHDSIRKLHNGKGTFYKIIENTKKILAGNIKVSLGIHINSMEDEDVERILNILSEEGLHNCYISFAYLTNYNGCCEIDKPLTVKEYSEKNIKYIKMLRNHNINKKWILDEYPNSKNRVCTANRINSFVVNSLGDLYTCWPEIGELDKSIGNIVDIDDIRAINHARQINYMLWSPFKYEKCRKCEVLPICMGGCSNRGLVQNDPKCTTWKFNVKETLKLTYDNKHF